jgi:hypothetical protein
MELLLKFCALLWEWTNNKGVRPLKLYLKPSVVSGFETLFRKFTVATS